MHAAFLSSPMGLHIGSPGPSEAAKPQSAALGIRVTIAIRPARARHSLLPNISFVELDLVKLKQFP